MLPVNLDQYSRSRLAHYTGYKPRQGGLSVVQPAQGPTDQTTQGFVDTQVTEGGTAFAAAVVHWGDGAEGCFCC
jgi:hypothetical protein